MNPKPAFRGHTPLSYAVLAGSSFLVEHLLANGADPAHGGQLPLAISADQGHLTCAQLILDAGADPNLETEDWAPPLIYAAKNGHHKIVKVRLKSLTNER